MTYLSSAQGIIIILALPFAVAVFALLYVLFFDKHETGE